MKKSRLCFILLLQIFFLSNCKDDNEKGNEIFDPDQPVTITDFSPHEGGSKTRMLIYGENFGNDLSLVNVKIGGKEAKIISVKQNCIYCFTPPKCFEGTIELKIGENTIVKAKQKYKYIAKRIVSTLCGRVDILGNGKVMQEGKFEDIEKIDCPTWLSLDPKNSDIMYCVQDNGRGDNKPMLKFDMNAEYMSTPFKLGRDGVRRIRTISWTPQGDSMIVAADNGARNAANNILLKRSENFSTYYRLTTGNMCPSSTIHPKTGDLYYSRFSDGTVHFYDYKKYGLNHNVEHAEMLFSLQDKNWEFYYAPHPSGDYMYILVNNRHYIMRSNFNPVTKKYVTPYIVAGKVGEPGYQDKVGTNARLNCPYQGVFVKNPKYKGQKDEYDFYFTDRENHCIRILTPEGVISTFAGRGSAGMNSNPFGYVDGDLREEARFNKPVGITYDDKKDVFYISDRFNHRIRKIAYENPDEE